MTKQLKSKLLKYKKIQQIKDEIELLETISVSSDAFILVKAIIQKLKFKLDALYRQ